MWRWLLWWWRSSTPACVSGSWLAERARLDSQEGWTHPMMPRWKSPREIAQERRMARRIQIKKSA